MCPVHVYTILRSTITCGTMKRENEASYESRRECTNYNHINSSSSGNVTGSVDDNGITYADDEAILPVTCDVDAPPSGGHVKKRKTLSLSQRLAFSIGHIFNDLCSAIWFTYLLVYFQDIRGFSPTYAGLPMLIGQIADGIATTFVGFESDRSPNLSLCSSYGKRKSWHLIGTIAVAISFPLIFTRCIGCTDFTSSSVQLFYYSTFIVLFQFGWAAVQISHLSLIPELTSVSQERTELNSYVYAWQVMSNITVYAIMWILFGMDSSSTGAHVITKKDETHFHHLVLIVISIGASASLAFHVCVREKCNLLDNTRSGVSSHCTVSDDGITDEADYTDDNSCNSGKQRVPVNVVSGKRRPSHSISLTSVDYTLPCNHMKWHQWFTVSQFYKVSLLYVATRLCINLTQAYIPFYLQKTLNMNRVSCSWCDVCDASSYAPLLFPSKSSCALFLTSISANLITDHKLCPPFFSHLPMRSNLSFFSLLFLAYPLLFSSLHCISLSLSRLLFLRTRLDELAYSTLNSQCSPTNLLSWCNRLIDSHHWTRRELLSLSLLSHTHRLSPVNWRFMLMDRWCTLWLNTKLQEAIAYIPLFMYVSGFLSSFLIKYINGRIGKKVSLSLTYSLIDTYTIFAS